jgi:hypothetical protein
MEIWRNSTEKVIFKSDGQEVVGKDQQIILFFSINAIFIFQLYSVK